ncbi:MAG: hypothetical protein WDA09_01855 [Bacteriovoracaceae bacterium]
MANSKISLNKISVVEMITKRIAGVRPTFIIRGIGRFLDLALVVVVPIVTLLIIGRIYLIISQDPIESLLSYLIYGLSDPIVRIFLKPVHFTTVKDLVQSAIIPITFYSMLIYSFQRTTKLIRQKYLTE